jgi:putative tryptophan/tyrosine transport system substrate-binding protein
MERPPRQSQGTTHGIQVLGVTAIVALLLLACGPAPAAPVAAPAAPPAASGAPAAAAPPPAQAKPAEKVYRVAIAQFFSHPVIDDFREGFIDGMKGAGFVDGQNVRYDVQNGQFSMDTLRAIAQKFQADRPDLIFTLTTPATLATLGVVSDIPVVFGLVTDAKAAGILKDTEHPDRNATGVLNWWPTDKQLASVKAVLPNARRIGVPYNNGESNARTQVESYRHDAAALGMEIVEVNAASTNEVQAATQSLVGRADTLMIIGDNTIQAALGAILKVGFDNNLPVVAADPENAKDGALTGWGILQRQAGVQSGELAARLLKGAKVEDTPVELPKRFWWTVNTAAAQRLSVTIPPEVMSQVDQTFDSVQVQ